ncbi:MAG TPA: DNA repair protein RadC [Candidatus Saccharicenans sp.]|jgi:DNA repair protein RadC|nr:DNA repair protein RadC [Candidatus Saccharicenans sp.]HQO75174.1 DNA repair protein RadC [Candidatus Saccharicenans sp.]HUM78364.1 DNA repair protein RadC [Candidatus Saccharicenans sp.]
MAEDIVQARPSQAGHRQRLREKFLKGGLAGFLDYEIVELLLTLGTPRKDCQEAARLAIKEFKNFRGVMEADPLDLQKIKGIGRQNVFGLKLVQEVARRYLKDCMIKRPVCKSSQEVFDYLYYSLRDLKIEVFKVLFLNTKNHILEEKTLFEGTVDSSAVYPREVIKQALKYEASSLIFVHNHPSGDPEPSSCDREITRDLVFACAVMQIRVLDHIVIGNNCYYSFADEGLIEKYQTHFYNVSLARAVD